MSKGLLIGRLLLCGELAGPFVQLRSHFRRFLGRTTQCDQHRSEFLARHGQLWIEPLHFRGKRPPAEARSTAFTPAFRKQSQRSFDCTGRYFTWFAGTILMLSTPCRWTGLLGPSPLPRSTVW